MAFLVFDSGSMPPSQGQATGVSPDAPQPIPAANPQTIDSGGTPVAAAVDAGSFATPIVPFPLNVGPPGPPGPQGNGLITSVANVAAAVAADVPATTPQGSFLFVQSLQRYFTMDTTSGAAVDGTTVLTASGGTRRWIWLTETNNGHWATVWAGKTVTIDPVNGNDENDGVTSPLKNILEGCRRLRTTQLQGTYIFNFLSTPNASDRVEWIRVSLFGATLTINGLRTATRSSTLTAGTAVQNSAAAGGGTPTVLADSSLVNWVADVGSLLRDTTQNPNTIAWVMKDTGAQTARASITNRLTTPGSATISPLSSGDSYVIENPCALKFGVHDFINDNALSSVTYNDFDMKSVSGVIAFFGVRGSSSGMQVIFQRCRMTGNCALSYSIGCTVGYLQCLIDRNAAQPRSGDRLANVIFESCAFTSSSGRFQAGFFTLQLGDNYFQAIAGNVSMSTIAIGPDINIGPSAAFDCVGGGTFGGFDLARPVARSGGLWWGNNNAAWGVVLADQAVPYTVLPSVQGAVAGSNDFNIDNNGTFRTFNETTGVYGPQTTTSWANLNAASEGSGFDVRSQNGFYVTI